MSRPGRKYGRTAPFRPPRQAAQAGQPLRVHTSDVFIPEDGTVFAVPGHLTSHQATQLTEPGASYPAIKEICRATPYRSPTRRCPPQERSWFSRVRERRSSSERRHPRAEHPPLPGLQMRLRFGDVRRVVRFPPANPIATARSCTTSARCQRPREDRLWRIACGVVALVAFNTAPASAPDNI